MQVAFFLFRTLNEGVGGDFNYCSSLAGKLRRHGVDVIIGEAYKERNIFRLTRKYIKQLKEVSRKADIIHCCLGMPSFSLFADIISKENKIPILVTFLGAYADNLSGLFLNLPRDPFYYAGNLIINNKFVAGLSKFRATHYVVSSEYQKKQLLDIGMDSKRLTVIPNAIDTDGGLRLDRASSRREFGFTDAKIITYIGHFRPNKGVEFLILAFKDVLKIHPQAKLVLAWSLFGSDKKVKKLLKKSGIKDSVILLERVDVFKLLSASDILVLPYVFEFGTCVYPLLVLECFSVGVPLVTSDLRSLRELTNNGRAALLTTPQDTKGLSSAILRLIEDKNLSLDLVSEQGKIREKYNLDKTAEKYVSLYQRLLHG